MAAAAQNPHNDPSPTQRSPILAILNPINLHRPTSSFSAQGLNKFFAAAIDTAHVLDRKLLVVECTDMSPSAARHVNHNDGDVHSENEDGDDDASTTQWGLDNRDPSTHVESGDQPLFECTTSPWDEEVSILNVTTKSFGAGERGWAGRTVTIRRIAERWCSFEKQEVQPISEAAV